MGRKNGPCWSVLSVLSVWFSLHRGDNFRARLFISCSIICTRIIKFQSVPTLKAYTETSQPCRPFPTAACWCCPAARPGGAVPASC